MQIDISYGHINLRDLDAVIDRALVRATDVAVQCAALAKPDDGHVYRDTVQQIAGFLDMADKIREIVGISGEIEVETEDSEKE